MSDENPTIPPPINPDATFLDGLSQVDLTPLTIRRIFLLLTRSHYSSAENFGQLREKMENFIWHKNEKERKLYIDYDYRFDASNLDRRPAIYCGTSDFGFSKIASDNFKKNLPDNSGEEGAILTSTTVIIRHVGKVPEDSLALSELSLAFFLGMRRMIMERVKPASFDIQKLVTSRPFEHTSEQADQQFYSDLVMAMSYFYIWDTIRESHRIKTVGFKAASTLFSEDIPA